MAILPAPHCHTVQLIPGASCFHRHSAFSLSQLRAAKRINLLNSAHHKFSGRSHNTGLESINKKQNMKQNTVILNISILSQIVTSLSLLLVLSLCGLSMFTTL
jgi:hypothetical protein